jgi:hypothetical protein
MCLLVAYQVIVVIVVPTQCTPLKKLWDFKGEVQGHCINANAFYHGQFSTDVGLDMCSWTHACQLHPHSTS